MARSVVPPLNGWAGAGLFAACSVAWTWPALRIVVVPSEVLGRQRDALATVAFIDASRRVGLDRVDALGAWPMGNPWYHPDSWTLVLLSALFRFADPVRLHAMVALAGVLIMGLAAERLARAVGARSPWSWIAAVAFAHSAFASTALLEGYAYHLLNPWMPLAVFGAWKVGQHDGRWAHAGLGAVGLGGALLTTAYVGMATAVVIAVLGVRAAFQGRPAVIRTLVLLLGCAAIGGMYALDFQAHAVTGLTTDATVQGSSASLVDLLPPSPAVDFERSSQSAMVSASVLALAAAAPVVLRRRRGWRGLLAAGGLGLLLSLGPHLSLDRSTTSIPLPLSFLLQLPGASLFRFPARLGWAWALCGGLVAALVATELGRRNGRPALLVLGLVGIDAFLGLGLPKRQRTMVATTPSAYRSSAGPVLDLFPGEFDPGFGLLWYSRLACFAQVGHQRSIPYDCIGTSGDPGSAAAAAYRDALLNDWPLPAPIPHSIAFHPDFFRANDRETILSSLLAYDDTPVVSMDGGDHVVLFDLPR